MTTTEVSKFKLWLPVVKEKTLIAKMMELVKTVRNAPNITKQRTRLGRLLQMEKHNRDAFIAKFGYEWEGQGHLNELIEFASKNAVHELAHLKAAIDELGVIMKSRDEYYASYNEPLSMKLDAEDTELE